MTTETAAAPGDTAQQAGAAATAEATAAAAAPATGNGADATKVQGEGATSAPAAAGEAAKPEGEKPSTPEVPEKYDLQMPDGVDLDTAAADEFTAIAKDLKLSQADAQKLAGVAANMQLRQAKVHAEMVKGWEDQSKADTEFGGDAFDQNVAVARKAIDTFGSPQLKELLNTSGLGNHPEVIRAFFKAGKAISEPNFRASGTRAPVPEADPAKRLYPNMN
jgi:hypothetical protein